jgi:hypothetical protein
MGSSPSSAFLAKYCIRMEYRRTPYFPPRSVSIFRGFEFNLDWI